MTLGLQDLMETQIYHPSLNSAIFDGPLRIYFAQAHEHFALRLYFHLQKLLERYQSSVNALDSYYVVIIYPQNQLFHEFGKQPTSMSFEHIKTLTIGAHLVLLTHCEITESEQSKLHHIVEMQLAQMLSLHLSEQLAMA